MSKKGKAQLQRPGRKDIIHRETCITFLPTCSICRNYPAQLINGVWLCRGQHDV